MTEPSHDQAFRLPSPRLPVSVVIPALDAAVELPATLAEIEGRVLEIVLADGGSTDATAAIAKRHGARIVQTARGRGVQLSGGANAAAAEWLLFLHADTRLLGEWVAEVRTFIAAPANRMKAACFRFRLDDDGARARRLERLVAWRCRRLGLPYGDQGLLIHRDFYNDLGGFRPLPLMEDVDLVQRIGRRRIIQLQSPALTSAARYRRDGYWRRPARNLCLLSLYWLGVPPRWLVRAYG